MNRTSAAALRLLFGSSFSDSFSFSTRIEIQQLLWVCCLGPEFSIFCFVLFFLNLSHCPLTTLTSLNFPDCVRLILFVCLNFAHQSGGGGIEWSGYWPTFSQVVIDLLS